MLSAKIEIAVIGRFQIGKSSLVNCLLGRSVATVGNGEISETPTCSDPNDPNYLLSSDVVLVDTPGVDDKAERDEAAEKAIKRAQCVLFVNDNERDCGLLETRWIEAIKEYRKPCVFVLNCMRRGQRSYARPDSDYNVKFCKSVHDGFIVKNHLEDLFLTIRGSDVHPVNVCWAQYGLGLLMNAEKVGEVEELFRDKFGVRPEMLQSEAVKLSNIGLLKDLIGNIWIELMAHFLRHKEKVLSQMVDQFCEEFTKRMAG